MTLIKDGAALPAYLEIMWPYHPQLLDRPVPRYTSYPPATAFTSQVGAREQEAALTGIAAGTPTSLYVHIPYCRWICWYCGCNTGLAGKAQRLSAYLDALDQEIALVARLTGGRPRVQRIAFGGGSPNAIEPLAFARLVDRLATMFGALAPLISVEIDPRGFTAEWARTLALSGVSRASLGVQSFDPDIQAAIGRIQPPDLIHRCMDDLRANGIASINFDLMYGLPGQGQEELTATLETAHSMQPDRIALFGYAHLPAMFPRQRRIEARTLPDAKARFDLAALGHRLLVNAGYVPIGFDHFARAGDPMAQAAARGRLRRNFQGFTDDDAQCVIGLGASAISVFPELIVQNEKAPGLYRDLCAARSLPATRGLIRSDADRETARLIESLLCRMSAPLDVAALSAETISALQRYETMGLVRQRRGRLDISEQGRPYARHVAALFDSHSQHEGAGGLR